MSKSTTVTPLSDLKDMRFDMYTFFNDQQKKVACQVVVPNVSSLLAGASASILCFWCRCFFDTKKALGCPLQYKQHRVCKAYPSDGGEIYSNSEECRANVPQSGPQLCLQNRGYYVTDGIFCSYNCIKAWIDDHRQDVQYNQSETLMYKMFFEMTGKHDIKIRAAPHWRLFKVSGGNLDWNENLIRVECIYHGTIKTCPVARIYEKHLVF